MPEDSPWFLTNTQTLIKTTEQNIQSVWLKLWPCYVEERECISIFPSRIEFVPGFQAAAIKPISCLGLCTHPLCATWAMFNLDEWVSGGEVPVHSPPLFRLHSLWQWFKHARRGGQHNALWQDAVSIAHIFCSLLTFIPWLFLSQFWFFFFLSFSDSPFVSFSVSFFISLTHYLSLSVSGSFSSTHFKWRDTPERQRRVTERGSEWEWGRQQAFCWEVEQAQSAQSAACSVYSSPGHQPVEGERGWGALPSVNQCPCPTT